MSRRVFHVFTPSRRMLKTYLTGLEWLELAARRARCSDRRLLDPEQLLYFVWRLKARLDTRQVRNPDLIACYALFAGLCANDEALENKKIADQRREILRKGTAAAAQRKREAREQRDRLLMTAASALKQHHPYASSNALATYILHKDPTIQLAPATIRKRLPALLKLK